MTTLRKDLIITLMLLAAVAARAFDFSATTTSGHLVYYSIFEGTTDIIAVNPGWSDHTQPSGLLVLDATVTHDGINYHLTGIDANAFMRCSNLTGIVIPEGVTTIGRMAFAFCEALDSVSLPSTLEEIGSYAFTETAFFSNHLNAEGMLIAGTYLIATSSSVEDSLVVPEGITGLGNSAVYHCYMLGRVVLPSTLRFIGGLAFQDCLALDTVVLRTAVPPSLGYDAFLNAGTCVIAVPCSTAANYQAVEEWQGMTIVERCPDDDTTHEAITMADSEQPITVATVAGGITVSLNGIAHCTVSDMAGRTVAITRGRHNYIPLPSPGVYFVSGPETRTLKIIYIR